MAALFDWLMGPYVLATLLVGVAGAAFLGLLAAIVVQLRRR